MAEERTHKRGPLRFAILAIDVALFAVLDGLLRVLLIPVDRPPHFVDMRGLPGGLIAPDETAEQAVARHLRDKAEVVGAYVEQLATFSALERDPRGRVVSVAYLGLMPAERAAANPLAHDQRWVAVERVGRLAYDHNEMLAAAGERLRARLGYSTVARHLMPREFTLSELQTVYEIVFGRAFDKRNFRKKLHDTGIVRATGHMRTGQPNRPAELYRFAGTGVRLIELF
jgi:8-oxo-dGTP diphosphatase